MEKGIKELEVDEFEKLLGEIPTVTSGTPNSEECGLINFTKDLKMVSMNEKFHKDGNLDEATIPVNEVPQSHLQMVQQEEPNLPDDHSLTSAFAELSFNEGVTNFKSIQNHPILFDGQYPNGFTKLPPNVESQAIFVPSFQPQNNSPSSFENFVAKNGFQGSSNAFKPNVQELRKHPVGYRQPIENFSGSLPLTHRVPCYQYLSNMPVHGIESPVLSDQGQYSQLPYIHSQLSQPHVTWRSMEEEIYNRMHKQYHAMSQNPIHARLMSQNLRQPCNEAPIANHFEIPNQEPMRNKVVVPRNIHLPNPALSNTDFNKRQVLDKVGKPSYPEKILMRSQGLNSLRSVKFGSFVGNELLADVKQNGRVFSNGHYQLHGVNLRCLMPVTADLKHNNARPVMQYNSIDEVVGRIYFMAKDQNGCRFLQRKFTEGSPEDVEKIFLEIIVHIIELMTDPFGNYLVQKLLEVCNEDQRMQIIRVITRKCGDLVNISCDMHGTRAVQKVIETLKTPEQSFMVVSALKSGIVTVIKNMNGNHVAQRCLQYLMPEYCEFLFEAAIANCIELATDRHGCCVLQKCLSHSDGEQRHHLIHEITKNALILSQNPYGNYVVQFIFDIHVPWATVKILDQLEGNYADLSVQKYSSNVVERCLKYAGEERRSCIVHELINDPHLDQIMQDPYGNYVIQAALNHSKGTLHAALVEAIRPHVPLLRTSPYGKKILSSNGLKK